MSQSQSRRSRRLGLRVPKGSPYCNHIKRAENAQQLLTMHARKGRFRVLIKVEGERAGL